jgi:hypothetical protein
MTTRINTLRIAIAAAVLVALSAGPALAQSAGTGDCRLVFTRADNMWGSAADSRRNLGIESITLQASQKKPFVTDWRYEKTKNDGSTYYGSHGRTFFNGGTRVLKLALKTNPVLTGTLYLDPGQSREISGDIVEVICT